MMREKDRDVNVFVQLSAGDLTNETSVCTCKGFFNLK